MRLLALFVASVVMLTGCTSEPADISYMDGSPADIDSHIQGELAVVNFWAASCAFCRHELPWFESAAARNSDIVFVGVNMQEPQRIAQKYWSEGGYSFPSLLDPNNELRRRFRVSIQPTTVFLNQQGEIVSRKDGPLSETELDEHISHLLSKDRLHVESVTSKVIPDPPSRTETDVQTEIQRSPVPTILSRWYSDEVKHTLDLDDLMSGGPDKDGIPAIDDPKFISTEAVDFMTDDSLGILVEISGDVRYYPYDILNWHEIVNDTVGGRNIFVTYCPLCATGVVYGRDISIGETTFGVSGFLSQSNLLMYDRATDSLWNQVTGEAVVGELTSKVLEYVRSDVVSFASVKHSFPQAKILSTNTGHARSYTRDPYDGYDQQERLMFPVRQEDGRLHQKELVYGIVVDGQAKAYTWNLLRDQKNISDVLQNQKLTIQFSPDTEQVLFTNESTKQMIPNLPVYWFSWVAQYPDTLLLD